MKVITAYPVTRITTYKTKCGDFSSLDASSTNSQIKAFQDWLDIKHPNWYKGGRLNKKSGYGTFGPATKAAYGQYGAEFESGAMNIMSMLNNPMGQSTSNSSSSTIEPAKKGKFFDKLKGAFGKAKDSGAIDMLKNKFGKKGGNQGSMIPGNSFETGAPEYGSPRSDSGKKPMSTGLKIGIGLGIAAVIIGVGVYLYKKKKGGKK